MRPEVHALPFQMLASLGVLHVIVLPVIGYSCQSYPCSLGADVTGPFLSAQGWPLLPRILLEQSYFPIPYLP
jgi:hypothetical protein